MEPALSQDYDLETNAVRLIYSEIRENVDENDTVMVSLPEGSSEGGQAIAYFIEGEIRLIKVKRFGEMGRVHQEFYFKDDRSIFVLDEAYSYNRPIYWDEAKAKENNDTEFYDPNKTTIAENRYYFEDELLFLWLDPEHEAVDLLHEKNAEAGLDLINEIKRIRSKF
ncbi:MAG: hypothetical protein HKN39_05180 [Flavobacteriales bacterium]|nr:hypothetical protein [Flavobacteriales bacterium]